LKFEKDINIKKTFHINFIMLTGIYLEETE